MPPVSDRGVTGQADLLVLDLRRPAPDGYEVLAQLESRRGGTTPLPVLVLTADSSPQAKLRALAAGADDFMQKPFQVDKLLERACDLLEMERPVAP